MRQCPDRYTIRAGQNLPDKEFRYLRTVIVTAAVYWGFNSCGSVSGAPLIPKLRGQFAEFLNYPSPVGLRILFLTTCVGLRYGRDYLCRFAVRALKIYIKLFSSPSMRASLLQCSVPYARVYQPPGHTLQKRPFT